MVTWFVEHIQQIKIITHQHIYSAVDGRSGAFGRVTCSSSAEFCSFVMESHDFLRDYIFKKFKKYLNASDVLAWTT